MSQMTLDEDMAHVIQTWAELASHFIGDCFDYGKPFLDRDYEGLESLVRFVSTQLFIDCHLTSESVLLLIREGKEWDADLINRSVLEGSLKYVFMLQGNAEEVRGKVEEYWHILPGFAAEKREARLKGLLAEIPNPESLEWEPFRHILKDTALMPIAKKYTRAQKKALEIKWSFFGITKHFMLSDNHGLRLFGHLAYGYGMSSHLLHKDGDGIGMVWERSQREHTRQSAVKLAHAARVVSDSCTFSKLRLLYLLKACKEEIQQISSLESKYSFLFSELHKANENFHRVEYCRESES